MRFEVETRIPAPPSVVFGFHVSPGALARLTPHWANMEVLSGGDSTREGSRTLVRLQIGSFPVRWELECTEYEPVFAFTDRQVQGPFAHWYHRHIFFDDDRGGTLLREEIDYELPLGSFGRWVAADFVRRKLGRIFEYRHAETRRIIKLGDFPGAPPIKPARGETNCGPRLDPWEFRDGPSTSLLRGDIGRDIGSREIEVVK